MLKFETVSQIDPDDLSFIEGDKQTVFKWMIKHHKIDMEKFCKSEYLNDLYSININTKKYKSDGAVKNY